VVFEQVDRMRAQKRDVAREQSLQAALAESSVRLEAFLAAEQSSPSELAERKEMILRLSDAIDQLPEDQRDAIIHHHLLGTPVAEIARLLGKTDKAVAMMLYHASAVARVSLIPETV
jgi:RNA polymerase sigma-70 factor (ECF subfamily)